MKKYNWNIGIPFSLIIAVISSLPRLIRFNSTDLSQYVYLAAYYFVFSLLTWYLNHLLIHAPLLQRSRRANQLFFAISIPLGCVLSFAYDYLNSAITNHPLQLADLPATQRRTALILFRGIMFNGLIAFLVFHLKQMKDKQQGLLELEHLKQAQLQARLSSLKEQLSPHFLFNTLNTLSTLTQEAPVKHFVNEMANLYRYILKNRAQDHVQLEEEMAFIHSYLYILEARFGQSLQVEIAVDKKWYASRVPPLVLQMLVENAVKHNIVLQSRPLVLRVFTEGEYIVVQNNLQPRQQQETTSGIGLNNIYERYKLLFGRDVMIRRTADAFCVQLPLII
ncbi:hypothetical protein GCM10009415_14900 [Chitinophaga japonensis]